MFFLLILMQYFQRLLPFFICSYFQPDVRSVSSNSSASLMGHSPTRQQDRNSPMERRGSLPRRTRSGPMVRVTSMPDVKNSNGLRPAPSTVSVESSSNGKSGVSYKFQPINDAQTFVEVRKDKLAKKNKKLL